MKKIFAIAFLLTFPACLAHAPKRVITPTMVFLEDPVLKQRVRQTWGKEIAQYSDSVIKPVLFNEVRYNYTHYCFYHAQQPFFQLVHDLSGLLYKKLGKGNVPDDFVFLRFWQDGVEQMNANAFIDARENGDHTMRWYNREVAGKVLSVNLALFGNLGSDGECSFHYFLKNYSVNNNFQDKGLRDAKDIAHHLVRDILEKSGLNVDYAQPLSNLIDLLECKTGNLFQILIPKEKVNDWVYVCHGSGTYGFGTPYRLNNLSDNARVQAAFNPYKNRFVKISPLLDAYKENSESLFNMNKIQARIVFVPELLDPRNGLKVIKYGTIEPKALAQYHRKLEEIVDRMMARK